MTTHRPTPIKPADRDLVARLERAAPGAVRGDALSLGLYATDASIYEFPPLAVTAPRSAEEAAAIVDAAREMGVPVLPRGGGTSLAGQTANTAVVMDFSRSMNRLLGVEPEARRAIVEPGLVRDELNAVLRSYGLEFAPETSTSNRAAIGGMIANNSSGMRSVRYGRTSEHVRGATLLLSTGETVRCVDRTEAEARALAQSGDGAEARLWRGLSGILDCHRALIDARFPRVLRRVGGYSLDAFPPGGTWNLAQLACGSEGTLGVLLDAEVNLVPPPRFVAVMAAHFADVFESLRAVPAILEHDPLSAELMDRALLDLARTNPSTASLCGFLRGRPDAVLAIELEGGSAEEVRARMESLESALVGAGFGYAYPVLWQKRDRDAIADVRKKGLGILLSVRTDAKPAAFIEDCAAPPERLAEFLEGVVAACRRRGVPTVMYGHASVGVIHIRPVLDLKDQADLAKLEAIAAETVDLVKEVGGSWSGEHGDGVVRGAFNERFWGGDMIDVFRQVKHLFDPHGIMNPGRVIDTPPVTANQRYGGAYRSRHGRTFFRFGDYGGGISSAVEMCNGVGACRKTTAGTMCPPYMVTRDERDSTRGRANALRLAMAGKLGARSLADDTVHEAMDLCIQCKACKTECPSNVDMARMKSEHLAHWYRANGGPKLRDRVFAEAPLAGRLTSGPLAPLLNRINGSAVARRLAASFLGLAPERALPPAARRTAETWFHARRHPFHPREAQPDRGEVALFADCWANCYETATAWWAVRVLEALGFRVRMVAGACCQRTRISKGFLEEAARDGGKSVRRLDVLAREGLPILALEPSCLSSFTDDLPDLVDDTRAARRVAAAMRPAIEFIAGLDGLPAPASVPQEFLLHGHCHQKALQGTGPALSLFAPHATVTELDSGCCGMAGSFGYEAEHYAVSMAMGERVLLPAVRDAAPDTVVLADGFSCRHQIADGTRRRAMHAVEAYGRALTGCWHR